jgi:hypothetical protein
MFSLKGKFDFETSEQSEFKLLVTAVKLPTGAIEVITNTQELKTKIEYLQNAYDHEFKLKNNPNVQIVGYMLV